MGTPTFSGWRCRVPTKVAAGMMNSHAASFFMPAIPSPVQSSIRGTHPPATATASVFDGSSI